MSVDECERALMTVKSNKTPGTDGLTSEFYRYFWNAVNKYMVDSLIMVYDTGHFLSLNGKVLSI